MATSQAANVVEAAVGHSGTASVTTDVSNYGKKEYGEETGAKIKATIWNGKNSVKLGMSDQRTRAFAADVRSRYAQAEGYRPRGCHSQGNGQCDMRQ
jgi:hypothetical protein